MRSETAQKKLKETQNQIKKLQKKAKELKPKANPEKYLTCADCGEIVSKPLFMRNWKDLHLCYDCKCKRACKEKEIDLGEMLLNGKVVEVIAERNTIYPDFVSLIIEKDGVKYQISTGTDELELEEVEKDD